MTVVPDRNRLLDRLLFLMLALDAILLAVLELLFLPVRIGALPFPVTALVAAVTLPWLVAMAGSVFRRPLVAGTPLWVWLLTVAVFGVGGPGGDVVLLTDWRTLLLLGAGVLPAAVVLGRLSRR